MSKFYVIKIFPYDPTFSGKYPKYEGYDLITRQKLSPKISSEISVDLPSKLSTPILSSTLGRGVQTATAISNKRGITKIKQCSLLNEVRFSLKELLSKNEYDNEGSSLVRRRFIEAFQKDILSERRQKIKNRMDRLLRDLRKLPKGKYLLVSHSFFMKIFAIYLKHNNLFERPEILAESFNYRKKTYGFGKGFEFTL